MSCADEQLVTLGGLVVLVVELGGEVVDVGVVEVGLVGDVVVGLVRW